MSYSNILSSLLVLSLDRISWVSYVLTAVVVYYPVPALDALCQCPFVFGTVFLGSAYVCNSLIEKEERGTFSGLEK